MPDPIVTSEVHKQRDHHERITQQPSEHRWTDNRVVLAELKDVDGCRKGEPACRERNTAERIASGVWWCGKCGLKFAGGAYFPRSVVAELTGELVCYGRSVVNGEWERMREGTQGDAINPWGVALFGTLQTVQPRTASQQSAYDKWLDQTSTREEARLDRIHGAVGVIPTPLWIVLFFTAGVIFVFMLFFADSGEGAVTQGVLMGTVVSVIVAMLLLLQFLDNPFHAGVGGLRPIAMERSLRIVDEALSAVGAEQALPCDAEGTPR